MPPAPGRIQSLPIKVLYTIDTSPQSFLAVLSDRHDVYVHPAPHAGDVFGSCTLKAIARGICFASPECVPNKSSLDFSVYNLEHTLPTQPHGGAQRPQVPARPASWTGKGFLSWALSESGAGTTLARGRLVREYEFAATQFAHGGGLEGLMAAASAGHDEEADGKGWGLEVTLTLRQLNPEGKSEFAHRRAFSDMLTHGGRSSASAPIAIASSPVRPSTRSSDPPRTRDGGFVRPAPPMPKPPSPSPLRRSTPVHEPVAGPSRTVKAIPSRHRDRDSSPTPTRNNLRERQCTPPPRPIDASTLRTPPQPSPSRAALLSILKRQDGKMSPDMVRQLSTNSFFQRLVKAVPAAGSPEAKVPRSSPRSTTTGGGSGIPGIGPMPGPPPPGPPPNHSRSTAMAVPGSDAPAPSSDAYPWSGTPTSLTEPPCNNCGATTSSGQWMTKKLKDGLITRVCNACGIYFNKHKRMRPSDLWDKDDEVRPEQPIIRSSPRLNRTRQFDHQQPPPAPPPVEPLPVPPVAESPRKRQRTRAPVPSPSPRMATRASAREAGKEPASPTPGDGVPSLDFASHFPFNGHNNPANAHASGSRHPVHNTQNGDGTTHNAEELEALFLQFADDEAATSADGNVTLEALFGKEDTEGIMELLKSIEAESSSAPPTSEV